MTREYVAIDEADSKALSTSALDLMEVARRVEVETGKRAGKAEDGVRQRSLFLALQGLLGEARKLGITHDEMWEVLAMVLGCTLPADPLQQIALMPAFCGRAMAFNSETREALGLDRNRAEDH